jgi:nicotinamide riboside kinase
VKIALLGAESTGKTWLAGALAQHLGDAGHDVAVVGEVLREWCVREGRTPRADEQLAIAQEQARRVLQASARIVIADTTPLMTAVYSELLFADRSLYAEALAHHAAYDLTLLMGLDLPWVADGLQRDGPHVREPVDALVRAALSRAGLGWQMVYGQGGARLQNALFAINSVAGQQGLAGAGGRFLPQNAAWTCEKCSDPDCEHRLFTGRLGLPAG